MDGKRTDGSINDFYKFEGELGRGAFGVVKKAINKKTGEKFAIKIVDKKALEKDDEMTLEQLEREVSIMSKLDHPHIVRLFEIFNEDLFMYLVMEIMKGGELFDRIVEKESYSEKEARDTIRPLVDAIKYCHDQGIIHRDLKPENLLYETSKQESGIKISDFGLARFCVNELAYEAAGTPGYVAPELISGKGYGKEVDYWSLGVILYVMLCGYPPFYDENNTALFKKILSTDIKFASPFWDKISDQAKDLIQKILCKNPAERYNSEQILNHPWIKEDGISITQIKTIPKNLKEYKAKTKFKGTANAFLAIKRMQTLQSARASSKGSPRNSKQSPRSLAGSLQSPKSLCGSKQSPRSPSAFKFSARQINQNINQSKKMPSGEKHHSLVKEIQVNTQILKGQNQMPQNMQGKPKAIDSDLQKLPNISIGNINDQNPFAINSQLQAPKLSTGQNVYRDISPSFKMVD